MASLYRVKKSLSAIERNMPDGYELFAHSHNLYLVNIETEEIIQTFDIDCDGGDPDVEERDGKLYLKR